MRRIAAWLVESRFGFWTMWKVYWFYNDMWTFYLFFYIVCNVVYTKCHSNKPNVTLTGNRSLTIYVKVNFKLHSLLNVQMRTNILLESWENVVQNTPMRSFFNKVINMHIGFLSTIIWCLERDNKNENIKYTKHKCTNCNQCLIYFIDILEQIHRCTIEYEFKSIRSHLDPRIRTHQFIRWRCYNCIIKYEHNTFFFKPFFFFCKIRHRLRLRFTIRIGSRIF